MKCHTVVACLLACLVCRTAWDGLKGLSKADASHQYVDFVTELVPDWQQQEVRFLQDTVFPLISQSTLSVG